MRDAIAVEQDLALQLERGADRDGPRGLDLDARSWQRGIVHPDAAFGLLVAPAMQLPRALGCHGHCEGVWLDDLAIPTQMVVLLAEHDDLGLGAQALELNLQLDFAGIDGLVSLVGVDPEPGPHALFEDGHFDPETAVA